MSDESPRLLLSDNNTDEITPDTANPNTNDGNEPVRTEKTHSLRSPNSPDIQVETERMDMFENIRNSTGLMTPQSLLLDPKL